MGFFTWMFQNNYHKVRDGYYLNHDNLVIANPEERKKLIFYFIASQVPEKLDPKDRVNFNERRHERLRLHERNISAAVFVGYLLGTPLVRSYYGVNHVASLALHFTGGILLWYLSESFAHNLLEPRFVGNDQLVADLSKKYDFSVFDFAQAKKDSHLKQLRAQLVKEGNNPLYA